jgi:hypothetical protein
MFEIMYFVCNHIYFVGVDVTIQEGTAVKRGELEQANMMMMIIWFRHFIIQGKCLKKQYYFLIK